MKKLSLLLVILLLTGCLNRHATTDHLIGSVTKIDAEKEMVWVGTNPLYVDRVEDFDIGENVHLTFTDPSLTEEWAPNEFNVTDVDFLDADFFDRVRKTAWDYLPLGIQENTTVPWQAAEVSVGYGLLESPRVELIDDKYDRQEAYIVAFELSGEDDSYMVLIEKDSEKPIGVIKPRQEE
ncbi:hypothetical protein [Planococcus lenghuensis]|uniref:DUF3221 domain-containing protein n=1 Tax=Planococcus lenghuensis TaxID=2213202 RepID=A0A1Q2KY05_9BACL|nr:hypothetical protein [Planococcus lenghuensis]AQQ53098.1 hypothetical protein B0X71_08320 [Planococcus lenghuensis]